MVRADEQKNCLEGYFGISPYHRPIPDLDEWLRRRVRMCYWNLSKSMVTQTGLTDAWREGKGLVGIRALRMNAQGYA